MSQAQIWLHSDWHLWHDKLYRFTYTDAYGVERRVREQFTTCAEGDAYIEQRWRELIKPQDHCYVLGDICMCRKNHRADEFVRLFKSLPGHKRLIPGNHDHLYTRHYAEAGFQHVRGGHMLNGLLLTHYPVHPCSITPRVKGNVHGHNHQRLDISPQHLNVSVERTGYAPVTIEWALEQLREKQKEL